MSAAGARDIENDARAVARLWWLVLLGGVATIVIGVLLLVWTGRTLEVIAILTGIELLVVGAVQILIAFRESSASRTGALLRGLVALIAGVIVIRHPGATLIVIALAVGIYLVLSGLVKFAAAVDAAGGRGWLVLGGLVDLAAGIVVVAWPRFGVASLALILGVTFLVRGALDVSLGLTLRSAGRLLGAD